MYKWVTVDMPEWGREGWRRTETLAKDYLADEQK